MKTSEVSHPKAAVLGLQHLLAMYSGAVLVPLLIGGALGFSATQMTYLVSIDIFMCGLATLIQLKTNRFVGVGLPVVLGCAIQVVEPLKMIGKEFGIQYMYGAIIAAGIVIVLISPLFAQLKRLFAPIVTGTLLMVIGLTLIPIAFQNIGGGDAAAKSFASPENLLIGFGTVLVIVLINGFAKGFLRAIAILVGLVAGTIAMALMGRVSLQPVIEATWFHLPQIFYFGTPKFEVSSIVTMSLIMMTTLVESTGVYFALSDIVGKKLKKSDMRKGYMAEGIAVILGGVFNTFPYTSFSQNVGLIQLTGIKTKKPIYYAAGFLILLGLLPKVGALATIIPAPVLGGAMLVMFSMVAMQGIKMLKDVDFNSDKNLLTVAISSALGLGVTFYPNFFAILPTTLRMLLSNGIVITIVAAIVLNLVLNGKNGLAPDDEKILEKLETQETN